MGFLSDLFGSSDDSSDSTEHSGPYSGGEKSEWNGPDVDGAAARPDGHTTVYGNDQHTSWDVDKYGQPESVHTTDHETREITDHPGPPEWTKP